MHDSDKESPGLYIHIPFCRAKCPYCDFFSRPASELIPRYLDALQREAALFRNFSSRFDTLYLGGGTPSLLAGDDLRRLFSLLKETFTLADDAEISMETNPEDITEEKASLLKELGVTRVTLGVQSFRGQELRFLRRRYTEAEAVAAVHTLRKIRFPAVALDLMYGMPGQSAAAWQISLETAAALRPEHLSCYQFTVKNKTPFGRMASAGQLDLPDEEKERRLFLFTARFLEDAGYRHYEISNFARHRRFFSRHNLKYWRRIPYLGLGPAAHSFDGTRRWWNIADIERYCALLEEGKSPAEGSEILTAEQARTEELLLGLRTAGGVVITDEEAARWKKNLAALKKQGFITVDGRRLLPTRKGFLIADRLPLLLT